MSHLPPYPGAGHFAEQGLAEFVSFGANNAEMIPSLVTDQLDVATAMQVSTLSAIEQGAAIRFVADKGLLIPHACATDAIVLSSTLDPAAC
jgi:hypothetical protein